MGVVSLAVSASQSLKDVVFHICNVALHVLHLDGLLSLGHSPATDMTELSAAASETEDKQCKDEFQVVWAENILPEKEPISVEEDVQPIEEKPSRRKEDNVQRATVALDEIAGNMHVDSIVSPKVFKQDEATTTPPEDASLPAKAMSAKPIDLGDEEALSSILDEDASIVSNPTEEAEEVRLKSLESADEEEEPQPEEHHDDEFTNSDRSLMKKPPAANLEKFVKQPQAHWSSDEEDNVASIHEMQQTAYAPPPFMPQIAAIQMSPRVSVAPSPSSSSSASNPLMPSMLTHSPRLTPKRRKFFIRNR